MLSKVLYCQSYIIVKSTHGRSDLFLGSIHMSNHSRMSQFVTLCLVLLITAIFTISNPVNSQFGAFSVYAPAEVVRGHQFPVTVTFSNAPLSGYHCIRLTLTTSQGFRVVGQSSVYISQILGGQSYSTTFMVQAPSQGDRIGTFNVSGEWSTIHGCGGTITRYQSSASATSRNPWNLSVEVIVTACNSGAMDHGVLFILRDRAGTQVDRTKNASRTPFRVSFEVLPRAGTYAVYISWVCAYGTGDTRRPVSLTRTVSVSANNQSFQFRDN